MPQMTVPFLPLPQEPRQIHLSGKVSLRSGDTERGTLPEGHLFAVPSPDLALHCGPVVLAAWQGRPSHGTHLVSSGGHRE